MKILQWIKSLFNRMSYQDNLERFIFSKHPQNIADVEYWVRHYDYHRQEWVI